MFTVQQLHSYNLMSNCILKHTFMEKAKKSDLLMYFSIIIIIIKLIYSSKKTQILLVDTALVSNIILSLCTKPVRFKAWV